MLVNVEFTPTFRVSVVSPYQTTDRAQLEQECHTCCYTRVDAAEPRVLVAFKKIGELILTSGFPKNYTDLLQNIN